MKSSRTAITIAYNRRVEVEAGVWENELVENKVKAEQQAIYQSRRDRALADKQTLTARFSVRSHLITTELDYVVWKGRKYKVNQAIENTDDHFTIIEIGELI
ncbi:DUF7253 family protein [Enterococcus dispar]|jgi:hypothetical protein|uniref:DUF7253 domain-containing protein n=1 Tax=Enterococcus dispar ATCC 51266 TaxID=1139219 RepID=S0KCW2_9ENTE|nr:hypothetical protein [Enterococcus dispar]EOT42749.1 hypothetical protein OMK_01110 [Enterococcus dispar ATCC 51266]EOW84800.1 hypothetical protein I569_00089 [Enterococcus dispar ATCC 51266]MDT2705762.1 phage head-tail adapter protein [Enterococcus dispar]